MKDVQIIMYTTSQAILLNSKSLLLYILNIQYIFEIDNFMNTFLHNYITSHVIISETFVGNHTYVYTNTWIHFVCVFVFVYECAHLHVRRYSVWVHVCACNGVSGEALVVFGWGLLGAEGREATEDLLNSNLAGRGLNDTLDIANNVIRHKQDLPLLLLMGKIIVARFALELLLKRFGS